MHVVRHRGKSHDLLPSGNPSNLVNFRKSRQNTCVFHMTSNPHSDHAGPTCMSDPFSCTGACCERQRGKSHDLPGSLTHLRVNSGTRWDSVTVITQELRKWMDGLQRGPVQQRIQDFVHDWSGALRTSIIIRKGLFCWNGWIQSSFAPHYTNWNCKLQCSGEAWLPFHKAVVMQDFRLPIIHGKTGSKGEL